MDCDPMDKTSRTSAGLIPVCSGCAGTSAFETLMFVSNPVSCLPHGTGSLVCLTHPGINPV